ncbi:2-isopropylmalate synthase [Marinobacter sp.]|uniref:2-isopropylmalate synthase n=1 Tax=Marinobacter sp. TaxID=50741 RepID=UPI003A8E3489
MIQTETRRQFYLGIAGIRLWYAREPLPGAAPSPELQFGNLDEPEQPLVSSSVPAAREPANSGGQKPDSVMSRSNKRGVQRIASLQALMEDKTVPSGKELPAPKLPSEAAPPSSDLQNNAESEPQPKGREAKSLNLNLAVFSGERYILIASVSKEASLRLQETLATNILKSLGEEQSKPAEWVQWPVFNNRLVAGGSAAHLMSVMNHVLRDSGSKKVIVLGSIDGTGVETEADGWLAEVLDRSPDIRCEHSLAELAGNPGAKRSLWQNLRPLVRA